MQTHLIENEIIVPSYAHYGGYSGFQDYGIIGTKIKNKLLKYWRQLFLNDDHLRIEEVECPTIVPECILKASGHVDKFSDYIITYNNKVFRADHLVKDYAKKHNIDIDVNAMDKQLLEKFINDNKIFDTNITIDDLNLMYKLNDNISYLRPEIAQTIFCNYNRFKKYLKKDTNFGIAQIGKSYRREISPKQFTRMREFTQAEIEFFFDPMESYDHLTKDILNISIPILSAQMQQQLVVHSPMQLNQIIENGIIQNKILLYFLYKIYLFITSLNIPQQYIRFRQHMNTEMAHYASECWDLEIFVDNDWLECIGCANRGCYDLETHSITKNNCLTAKRNDNSIYFPHIIEPSFGIDRLMYSIIHHNYTIKVEIKKSKTGDDEIKEKQILKIPNIISPYDFALFYLRCDKKLIEKTNEIYQILKNKGYDIYVDNSTASLGSKYIRADKVGINYSIAVDYTTLNDNTITIRNIIDCSQKRLLFTDL